MPEYANCIQKTSVPRTLQQAVYALDLDRAEYRAKGEDLHRAQVLEARRYFVSTVGRDKETIRAYIKPLLVVSHHTTSLAGGC